MPRIPRTLAAAIVLFPSLCFGWGREGHEIVAIVAANHLDESAKAAIRSLIGDQPLYSIANWADDIRNERPATKPWHYVNIPFGSKYDAGRDCPAETSCVVAQIERFRGVLAGKTDREQRVEALKFLVHFVADIHQPMHAVKEAQGGNLLHVRFLGSDACGQYQCNLHSVWDNSLIEHAGWARVSGSFGPSSAAITPYTPQEYAARLEALIKAESLDRQAGGRPEDWANESLALAQAAWVRDGANLDEKYYWQQIKVVDRQMALAGLRLAKLLNVTMGR